jgi:hypothetical protein
MNIDELLLYVTELSGLGAIVLILYFVSWIKIALGSTLVVTGAFFPFTRSDKATGKGALKWKNVSIDFRGSLRVGVILAGIILIITDCLSASQMAQSFDRKRDVYNSLNNNDAEMRTDPSIFEHDPNLFNNYLVIENTNVINILSDLCFERRHSLRGTPAVCQFWHPHQKS